MSKNTYDLVIIGGGAAGIMTAISAKRHSPELKVAIVDRTFALGRKILVCGAGRCNITNVNLEKSVATHYYGADPSFISSIFTKFSYDDLLHFFSDLGIELYVERKKDIGKMFPITNQASTVTTLLEDELQRLGVDIFLNTEVKKIERVEIGREDGFEIDALTTEKDETAGTKHAFISKYLVLSAGGKTYPALGSNGSGYSLAESLGHTIITPVPSALPLVAKNPLSQALQGMKLEMEVTSEIEGKIIKTRTDDVMFTQYGLSGPAILNVSREISIHLNRDRKREATLYLNFFPAQTAPKVMFVLASRWRKRGDQAVERSLYGLLPNKVADAVVVESGIQKGTSTSSLSMQDKDRLVKLLTKYTVRVTGTRGWNEAEFTAGGVDTKEVKETLESKKVPNLYFCGEILDVDGDVGGFNLSWAWSSGWVAGMLA